MLDGVIDEALDRGCGLVSGRLTRSIGECFHTGNWLCSGANVDVSLRLDVAEAQLVRFVASLQPVRYHVIVLALFLHSLIQGGRCRPVEPAHGEEHCPTIERVHKNAQG